MLLEETIALKGSTGNGEIARLIVWCNNDIIIYLEFAEIPTAYCTLTDSKMVVSRQQIKSAFAAYLR